MAELTEDSSDLIECTVMALDGIDTDDCEYAHVEADNALLDHLVNIGHEEVVQAYRRTIERCQWWRYA